MENSSNFNDIYDTLELITSGTMTRPQIASLHGDIIYKGRVPPFDTARIKDTLTEKMIRKYEWYTPPTIYIVPYAALMKRYSNDTRQQLFAKYRRGLILFPSIYKPDEEGVLKI